MNQYNQDYLAHYGVIGMKWGVRRNPQRAYEKATRKFDKLTKRSDKNLDRSGKFNDRALRGRSTEKNAQMASKAYNKAMKDAKRASKWMKSMEKEFSKQSIVSIDQSYIDRGAAMLERYRTMRAGRR